MQKTGACRPSPLRIGAAVLAGTSLVACASRAEEPEPLPPIELVSVMPAASRDVDRITWNLARGEPDTLNPYASVTLSSGQVVKNICDALLSVDPEFNVGPGIAELEQVSDTRLVFTVLDGAVFSDGSPVTAEDVVFSMERAASPDSVVSYVFAHVDSITATSTREVTVELTEPDILFSSAMSTIAGTVLKKEWALAAVDAVGTPEGGLVCSGPFLLEDWTSGNSLTLRRNDAYWNDEVRPFAEQVEFTFVTDATAMAQALAAGEIDGGYDLPASAIPTLRDAGGGELVFGPSTTGFFLSVARPDGPLADLKLREALQHVVDRQALADVVFHGAAAPAYTQLTEGTWPSGERELYEQAYEPFVQGRAYDLEAARALVEESDYDGETVVLAIQAGNETSSRAAQLIQ